MTFGALPPVALARSRDGFLLLIDADGVPLSLVGRPEASDGKTSVAAGADGSACVTGTRGDDTTFVVGETNEQLLLLNRSVGDKGRFFLSKRHDPLRP